MDVLILNCAVQHFVENIMNVPNFEKLSEVAKKLQEPLQAIADLNVKTIQSVKFVKPEELATIKKPEELLEKQIHLAIENGHKAVEYMQKSFQIYEKAMLGLVAEAKKASAEQK